MKIVGTIPCHVRGNVAVSLTTVYLKLAQYHVRKLLAEETIVAGVDGSVEKANIALNLSNDDQFEEVLVKLDDLATFVKESQGKISKLNNASAEELNPNSAQFR
ncbi:MAG: hypothetical protein LBV69_02060 [Bacteroidales bacterium]|jgi:hypothetical protein|nr:hypothetical protein [Bacteroidales bacterium]